MQIVRIAPAITTSDSVANILNTRVLRTEMLTISRRDRKEDVRATDSMKHNYIIRDRENIDASIIEGIAEFVILTFADGFWILVWGAIVTLLINVLYY